MLRRLSLATCCLLGLTIQQSHGLGQPGHQPEDTILPAIPMPKAVGPGPGSMLYGTPLFAKQESDTLYFGGTTWNPAKARWEALTDSIWTFESGVSSAINQDSTVKAVGLHSIMEGWYGLDMTAPSTSNPFHRSSDCAISGEWSLWAGVSAAAAESLGWPSGQGYGNNWFFDCEKTFAYPSNGPVSFSFKYRVESEPDFDFLRILVDTSGTGGAPLIQLTAYTETTQGTATIPLLPGETLPLDSKTFRLIFRVESETGYSDEDGLYPTSCGHSALDDVTLTGSVSDFSDFENGSNGWEPLPGPLGPGGDWSDIRATAGLNPSGCACVFGDSVLAFIDPVSYPGPGGGHGLYQDNVAISPWIDLAAQGVANRAGKILEFRGYWDLPYRNRIFVQYLARWRPAQLPPPLGLKPDHGFYSGRFIYYRPDTCYCPGYGRFDFSQIIPPDAEEVQIGVGIVNYCQHSSECSQITNQTPWFDDVRFGVYEAPVPNARLSADPRDLARDAFPEATSPGDFPHQTARFDSHSEGDFLIVKTDYAPNPSSVHVVFRVRPGPAIDAPRLSAWLAGFTPEPNGWVSARMDTVDQWNDGYQWRTVFHEEDPQFQGPEDTPDPDDPSPPGQTRLKNDMFPDNLFTPGTRIDYFFKWIAGGAIQGVSFLPDTTGGISFEMEVLPSSLVLAAGEPGYVHNAVLWVDRIGGTYSAPVESALVASFPGGSSNPENVAWDRFDLHFDDNLVRDENPTSLNGYRTIIWTSTSLNYWLSLVDDNPDSGRLQAWLRTPGVPGPGCSRNLYYCGNLVFGEMSGSLLTDLGIEEIQAWEPLIQSHCVHLLGDLGSSHFGNGFDAHVLGFDPDRLAAAPSGPDADNKINLRYQLPNLETIVPASVSAYHNAPTGCWRSVYDGFSILNLRDDDSCVGSNRVGERLGQVLDWFASDLPTPVSLLAFEANRGNEGVVLRWRISEAPSDHVGFQVHRSVAGAPRQLLTESLLSGLTDYVFIDASPSPERTEYWLLEHLRDGSSRWLGPAAVEAAPRVLRVMANAPNPFREGTTIRIDMPRSSHVSIRVFGPSGDAVARVFDGPLGPGIQDIGWDGRDAAGRPVPSGIYLYRVETMETRVTRKMLKLAR